jgi:Na+(H+)/acetate symporter ActP
LPRSDGGPPSSIEEGNRKLKAPKQVIFWVAVVVAVIGILTSPVTIPVLSGFAFWLVAMAFIILLLGKLIEGM